MYCSPVIIRLADQDEALAEDDAIWTQPASLDTRYRLLVPFGLRQVLGLGPGVRVIVIGVPDRSAVVLTRAQVVVTALLDRR